MSTRILMSRYFGRTLLVAVVSLAIYVGLAYADVQTGQRSATLRSPAAGSALLVLVFGAFYVAAWSAVDASRGRRILLTLGSSVIAFIGWGAIALLVVRYAYALFEGSE
jgi:hypothetical protein